MEMKLYTIKTRSGLHCGIGQGLSDIDLPTAKESVSGYPFIPGSSIKGVLRDQFNDSVNKEMFEASFGRDSKEGELDFASALSFGDARLICLPVRSYFGTFAYLASPYSLNILAEALRRTERTDLPGLPTYPPQRDTDTYRASVPADTKLLSKNFTEQVLLEDLNLLVDSESSQLAEEWAKIIAKLLYPLEDDHSEQARDMFSQRFIIADDDVMSFLCETALPVATRIRINQVTGVVDNGALFLEEFVPPEAIFLGQIFADQGYGRYQHLTSTNLCDFVCSRAIDCQVGGNATTGKGFVTINFCRGEQKDAE